MNPIARRYARALLEEAESAGRVDQVDADVVALRDSLDASRELQQLFASPLVPAERKQAVVERLFKDRIEDLVLNLMRLLIDKRRDQLLPDVVRAYSTLRDERRGELEARVRTAMPLEPEQEEALRRALEATTGRRIRLNVTHEPDLITGLVVRVGDVVYDRSARHQLKTLREQFAARKFVTN